MLNDVRLLCHENHPQALFASTDLCHVDPPARLLMLKQIRETGFLPSPALRQLLHPKGRSADEALLPTVLHNVGIFGGRLGAFEGYLSELAKRTRAHYDAPDHDGVLRRARVASHPERAASLLAAPRSSMPRHVLDMVIFHELVLHHTAGPVVRGWPHGPINLPFWGENCRAASYFCRSLGETNPERAVGVTRLREATWSHAVSNGYFPAINRSGQKPRCDMGDFLAAATSRHFFAHKLGCGRTVRC